jgi:hypothetical protein
VLLQARAAPVQRQPFAPPTYRAPPPGGDDAAVDDYDGHWADEELRSPPLRQRPAWLRFGVFLAGMSLIGASLAFGFDHSGLRAHAAAWSWPAAVPQFGTSPPKPQADDRLTSALAEIGALHRSVSELNAKVQQLATTNAALQTGEQELRQRMASPRANAYWYSDPAALGLRFVAHQRRLAAASPAHATTETTGTIRHNDNAPQSLRPPQP